MSTAEHAEPHAETRSDPDYLGDVRAFHLGMGQRDPIKPRLISPLQRSLRWSLIDEEVNKELKPAMDRGDLVAIADGIADGIYVLIGTALAYGIPLDAVWAEVHRSNMSKFVGGKAQFNEKGKLLKGDTFSPPNLAELIEKAIAA